MYVAIEYDVQLFNVPLLQLYVESVEADLAEWHALAAALLGYLCRHLLGGALIGHHFKVISCLRHFRQSQDTHRSAGRSLLHTLAPLVDHGTHFSRHGSD